MPSHVYLNIEIVSDQEVISIHVLQACVIMLSSALSCVLSVFTRETREGWHLLTVETEVNGDSRIQMKGVLPWLVCWACCAGTRDFCAALAALVRPSIKYFYPHRTLF